MKIFIVAVSVASMFVISVINACVSSQCFTERKTDHAAIIQDIEVEKDSGIPVALPAGLTGPMDYPTSADSDPSVYSYSGLIHYHTTYSDGGGSYAETIAIAESLGVDFVIPCDHNTVEPMLDGWSKRIGSVMVIPGVEHSMGNNRGHFLSIGTEVPPVRSADFPADSVYAVCARRNDILIAAHPFHPTHHEWRMWDDDRFTGMELYNMDENWRNNISFLRMERILSAFFVNSFRSHAMNHLLTYPEKNLSAFDEITQRRHLAGIGVTDAHSRIKSFANRIWRYPQYGDMFSLVQTIILSTEPLGVDYEHDRGIILDALHRGRSYIGFSGLQDTRGFIFTASDGILKALPGDSLLVNDSAELSIQLPPCHNTMIRIIRNGDIFAEFKNCMEVDHLITRPGVYRVEVHQHRLVLPFLSYRQYPWILSNPIYVHDVMGKTNDDNRSDINLADNSI